MPRRSLFAVILSICHVMVSFADDIVVPLKATPLDSMKDWKLAEPQAVKFGGTLPLSGADGKPISGRVDGENVYISLGQFGQKTIKAGDVWQVDASYGEKTERYAFKLEKGADGLTLRSANARVGSHNGVTFALVDVNSNGFYDDADDLLVVDKTTAVKLGGEVAVGKEKFNVKASRSGAELTLAKGASDFAGAMQMADPGVDGALNAWNAVRRCLKMQPLTRDPELERIGALHCKYMANHKQLTHPEDKNAPDYSEDGHKAGMGSVLSGGRSGPRDAILGLLDTFYHRIQMLQPDLAVTGINYEGGFAGANVHNGKKKPVPYTEPFMYPPDGAAMVRPGWGGREGPSPIPVEPPRGGVGQTVTITFPRGQKVTKGTMTLKEGSATGTVVDAWVSAPDKPAPDGASLFRDNMNTICLIGKAPLKPNTVYFAEATADVNGKPFTATWSFTTAKAPTGGPGRRR